MNAKETMKSEVERNLGYGTAEALADVKQGVVHYLGDDAVCIVSCVKEDEPYVLAIRELHPELTVRVIVREDAPKKARPPRGAGFGDRVWRKNSKHGYGVEVSFGGKPDEATRNSLKQMGFRWSHLGGVWYLPAKKVTEQVSCYLAGLTRGDDI